MFSIPVLTNSISLTNGGDVFQLETFLFNTGDPTCWVERGGFEERDSHDFHAKPEEVVRGAVLALSSETKLVTNVAVRNQYSFTFHHGAGQIGASIASEFVKRIPTFTLRMIDNETSELMVGPKDSSLSWHELPIMRHQHEHWLVPGEISIGEMMDFDAIFRFNTGIASIALPPDMYAALTARIAAAGAVPLTMLGCMVIEKCESLVIPLVSLRFSADIPIQLIDVSIPTDQEGNCMLSVSISESGYVELGGPFFESRIVHFDAFNRKVSITGLYNISL